MNLPSDQTAVTDRLEVMLESSCGLLMTLESVRTWAHGPMPDVVVMQAHLEQAIASLRRLISELRMARNETVSPVALGFIVASPIKRRPHTREPRPRRTA
jgi:hypothetical protein